MGLINTDVLLKKMEWLDEYDYYIYEEVKRAIDNVPTVDAVPIEWIEAFSKQQDKKQYKDFLEFMLNYWNMHGLHALEEWEKKMSKSVMIIDTPIDCCDCPFGTMAFGKSICLLDEGNGIDCPLKPYKDFIPVEWIEKYKRIRGWEVTVTTQNAIDNMLNAWEKENEQANRC